MEVTEHGLFTNRSKENLISGVQKVQDLTPAIGTEITGLDLRYLSNEQKDELYVYAFASYRILPHSYTRCSALLVAERGVVCMFPI